MSGDSPEGTAISSRRSTVRVVVAGDHATGKSSLIAAAASNTFPENISSVLPLTHLAADSFPDGIPFTIIDTPSSLKGKATVEEELKRADAIVLTYACDHPETLTRLQTFWIPEIRRLKVKIPVIVVGCKLDLRDEHQPINLELVMSPIMQQFREIETCIECSAANLVQDKSIKSIIVGSRGLLLCSKAVLHPTAPLFDQESQTLQPRCIRALKRIFLLHDRDMDSALNDHELNEFQVKCFNAPLQPSEILGVKKVVQDKVPEGVNQIGLTLEGFLYLHTLFIEKGRLETTWTVLRKFGYNNDLELEKENLPVPSEKASDQSVELTSEAVDFLKGIFRLFDSNKDGALQDSELDELFSTAPESPWNEALYKDCVERTEVGDLKLSGFLSQWDLMTLLDPPKSLTYLIYLGYTGDPATAFRVTRKRSVDFKKQHTKRQVFQCFVFGPKNSGKSALLTSFVGRPFQNKYAVTSNGCYTVNTVDQLWGNKTTLILHEIQEDNVKEFLSSKESLAACDVAVFLYDSSDEYSLKRASELLMGVARVGEDSEYGVPCLLIAAKDDLDPYPTGLKDSEMMCLNMKIDAPIRISVKEKHMNDIFPRIVSAAKMSGVSPVGKTISSRRSTVRVVVAGDHATGKSSLIAAAASNTFPENVSPVLPLTQLPANSFPDGIPVTIIDTPSSLEGKATIEQELKRADAIVLTYACDHPETLTRLRTLWLPEIRRLKVKIPVIVVGCKLDLRDEHHPINLEQVMSPIMQQFREIETCIECSAANLVQVAEVFYYAQKAVLHPTAPLFDQESQTLQPRCTRALKRIFLLHDRDMDSALNDNELNEFQVKCFNAPLQPSEIVGVKKVVQDKVPEGVNQLGLTLEGFLYLHTLFIEKGRLETTWTVLRKFGYNDDLELEKENLPVPFEKAPEQSVELTSEAVDFLKGIIRLFDSNKDGALQDSELDELFSTAPESPWNEAPYKDCVERTELGDLTLSGFLSQWDLMTLLDPPKSLAYLIYLGYTGDPATAFRVTRKRSLDFKQQYTKRHVFQCFVFGPKNSGKSALLTSFVGRPFQSKYGLTSNPCYTVNTVDQLRGNKTTLILHEIQEDDVKAFLSSKESLAACDVAVFLYDSLDEYSLKRTSEILMEVARLGEDRDYGVPCLLIAAKDDLDPFPTGLKDSEMICLNMKIDAPIRISVKEKHMNHVFQRIVSAAERCHLSVPETEHGRNKKHYQQLLNRSLILASERDADTDLMITRRRELCRYFWRREPKRTHARKGGTNLKIYFDTLIAFEDALRI